MAQSASHGMCALKGQEKACPIDYKNQPGDRFGRLFGELGAAFTDPLALERLGAKGGPMDAGTNPAETTSVPVGHVFFGQFVDHDITLDLESSLTATASPGDIMNARTPSLDLDCVYGPGPEAAPYLFHSVGTFKGSKLYTGVEIGNSAHTEHDLPRVRETAMIGDFRNDENRLVSQIQLGMIKFHNKMCDEILAGGGHGGKEMYEEARRLTTWHYQYCVVHDFLNKICGAGAVQRILNGGCQFFDPKEPFIPVEFSVAAYRFGHSMVPFSVQVQKNDNRLEVFGNILGKGFSPLVDPRAIVDMHEVFDTYENRQAQRAGEMNGKMSPDLLELPIRIVPSTAPAPERSLATRNLLRGQSFSLPSGEAVAALMGRPETEVTAVSDGAKADEPDLNNTTPLWYYILKEAEVIGREDANGGFEPGEGLGPVGATIVAEVIIGLMLSDERSYLATNRNWTPQTYANDASISINSVGNMLAYPSV